MDLLAGLNDAQREAVTTDAAPLCVHAGAGSGKTRVLTHRIAHRAAAGGLEPVHAVALTFTRMAADVLRSRLLALGMEERVHAGTFHALALGQLRAWWDGNRRPAPAILADKRDLVGRLVRDRAKVRPLIEEIEWASAGMVAPHDYPEAAAAARRAPPFTASRTAELLERYRDLKKQERVVDFDDLLLLSMRITQHDPEVAGVLRWRFRHFFVDEFQDVNALQFRFLRVWLGDRTDLFVVGDPFQAIYRWNGADARYLDRFEEHFPGARTIRLVHNYRSTPEILGVARAALGPSRALTPTRHDGEAPVIVDHDDEQAEAAAIARDVRARYGPGRPWSTQAVLVRTNAQIPLLSEALRREGVPVRWRGARNEAAQRLLREVTERLRTERYEVVLGDVRATALDDEPLDPDGWLTSLADEYESFTDEPTGEGFTGWLRGAGPAIGPSLTNAVEVATFHAAKGLEWPVVHLAGLEDGYVPTSWARTPAARDEERRLLFVAMTRAEDELRLHWARRRTLPAGTVDRERSPFLEPVAEAIAALAKGGVDNRQRAAEAASMVRRQRAGVDREARAAAERLRAWRTQAARAAGVPTHVILHDATLRAVADARPRTTDELLALPGLGPVQVQRFGDELLAALRPPAG